MLDGRRVGRTALGRGWGGDAMTTTAAPRNGAFPTDARSAVEAYLGQGLAPIPLPIRSKKPVFKDWPQFRLTLDNVDEHFPQGQPRNVGILNGEPSGNVT